MTPYKSGGVARVSIWDRRRLSFHWAIHPANLPIANMTVNMLVGNPHGTQYDAAVKIHVGIQIILDEILIF